MELPEAVRVTIEQEAGKYPIAKLEAASKGVSERYRGERVPGKHLVTSPIDVAAYAAVRMPATYGAVARALELSGLSDIGTLVDVGAGTGAAALAAGQLYPLRKVFCLERELAMRELGKKFLSDAEWVPFELGASRLTLHGDLVTAAYMLNELPEERRSDALETLWSAAGKALVLVEPGTPEGFRTLLQARRRLLKLGAHIAAPCTHEGECPLPREDWCSFTCRIARSRLQLRLKGGDVPYEDEKFCFLTAVREEPLHPAGRVLRHPQIAPGRVQLTVCTAGGIETRTISKKDKDAFKQARKAEAGSILE